MPRRKETEKFAVLGEKDCWHLYGLQALAPRKFTLIVGKILQGHHTLVRSRMADRPSL